MSAAPLPAPADERIPWYRGLSKYHWFILAVCWMAWFFDTMSQQLFILARAPAIRELLAGSSRACRKKRPTPRSRSTAASPR